MIQRYLGANFIMPFAMSTSFFVLFLLTFQLFKVMNLVINKSVDFGVVFSLIGHISITFLPLAIPLSILFATIYTLGKLSEDSEIIVMRSVGLDIKDIFRPILILSILISLVTFCLNASLIPHSKREFKRIITLLTSREFLADIKAGSFYTEIPGVTIFSEAVGDNGKLLDKVFIHTRGKEGEGERAIYAKKGILKKTEIEEGQIPTFRLHLYDGNIVKESAKDKKQTEKILFLEYDFPILTSGFSPDFATKDSMRSSLELWRLINLSPEELKKLEVSEKDSFKSRLEFWSRINTPLLCILFAFLGVGLGIQNARGRRRNTTTVCLIILVVYYALFFTGVALAKKGHYSPFVAVFMPTSLALLVGVRLYKKLEWLS